MYGVNISGLPTELVIPYIVHVYVVDFRIPQRPLQLRERVLSVGACAAADSSIAAQTN